MSISLLLWALVASTAMPATAQEAPATETEAVDLDVGPADAEMETNEPLDAPEGEPGTLDRAREWVSGRFEAGFDAYVDDGDSDLNLDQTLRLEIDPPEHPDWRVRSSLWLHEDLDSDEHAYSALRDLNDPSSSDARARLLYLYAEHDGVWEDTTWRLGRQRILESPTFNRVDGLYVTQNRGDWSWYSFAGARASIYEDTHEDLVIGGGASYRPFSTTRLALDYYYGEENRESHDAVRQGSFSQLFGFPYPYEIKEDLSDSAVSLSVWHAFLPNLNGFGRLSIEDGEADELVLDLTGFVPEKGWGYELSYRGQLNSVEDRVNDLTGYYRVLGPLEEYDHVLAAVHKDVSERVTVSGEVEWHGAEEDSRYTANHDYVRYAVIGDVRSLIKGWDAELGLEHWDVDEGENTWAVTGEVSKNWERLKWVIGADYEYYKDELYVYNPWPNWINQVAILTVPGVFSGTLSPIVWALDQEWVETHENIYSLYTRLNWAVAENQEVSTYLLLEEDEGPESPYWHLRVSYAIDF
jgi:hypothetical protein